MKKLNFILMLLLLAGCKERDFPKPIEQEPVFFLEGDFDGITKRIAAGENNYYLYTSFNKDSNHIYFFKGKFEEIDCQNCKESLSISISDMQTFNGSVDIAQALKPGLYNYRTRSGSGYLVTFKAEPEGGNPNNLSYTWDFGDGSGSTLADPQHTFLPNSSSGDSFNVQLSVSYSALCMSSIQNVVDLSSPYCKSYFTYPKPNSTAVQFNAAPTGTAPFSYTWTSIGTMFSNLPNPTFDFRQPGVFQVCLEVVDNNNCYSKYCRNVNVMTQNCATSFSYEIDSSYQQLDLSQVEITWIDESGIEFKSGQKTQPSSSYFKIINREDFKNNERNEAVQKIEVEFDCWVYSNSDSLRLSGVKGVTAVAYPK